MTWQSLQVTIVLAVEAAPLDRIHSSKATGQLHCADRSCSLMAHTGLQAAASLTAFRLWHITKQHLSPRPSMLDDTVGSPAHACHARLCWPERYPGISGPQQLRSKAYKQRP